MKGSSRKEILEQIGKLPLSQLRLVSKFVLRLKGKVPRGVPGKNLLEMAGSISPADLEMISKAINEGCERVDVNAW